MAPAELGDSGLPEIDKSCVRCRRKQFNPRARWENYGFCSECIQIKAAERKERKTGDGNLREQIVGDEYKRQGYEVLQAGWPDFLMVAPDGSISFREVKSEVDGLSPLQQRVKEILSTFGEYKVVRPDLRTGELHEEEEEA